MEEIKVNFENLTEEERQQLMSLVEKGNKTSKVWKPKKGEKYWYISCCGDTYQDLWNDTCDKEVYSIGNCFKTKEEAKNAVERLKIRAELQRYADAHNGKINWTVNSYKWCLFYDRINKRIDVDFDVYFQEFFQIYFSSKKIALNAIKAVGEDRIKKYLFEVEE